MSRVVYELVYAFEGGERFGNNPGVIEVRRIDPKWIDDVAGKPWLFGGQPRKALCECRLPKFLVVNFVSRGELLDIAVGDA